MADNDKKGDKVADTAQVGQSAQVDQSTQAAQPAEVAKERTVYSATSKADGQPTPGKLVKEGDLVRPITGADVMIDSLTTVEYPKGVWTEVERPSAWLDGQVKAKKMEVK